MIKIHQLPENYKHPGGISMGGFWACSEIKDGQSRLITCDRSKDDLLENIKGVPDMQSYYFTVLCYKRGQLQWVVEMEKLSRVASFLVASEGKRVKTHHECEIHVQKDYVSVVGAGVDLEIFKACGVEELKRMALEA